MQGIRETAVCGWIRDIICLSLPDLTSCCSKQWTKSDPTLLVSCKRSQQVTSWQHTFELVHPLWVFFFLLSRHLHRSPFFIIPFLYLPFAHGFSTSSLRGSSLQQHAVFQWSNASKSHKPEHFATWLQNWYQQPQLQRRLSVFWHSSFESSQLQSTPLSWARVETEPSIPLSTGLIHKN